MWHPEKEEEELCKEAQAGENMLALQTSFLGWGCGVGRPATPESHHLLATLVGKSPNFCCPKFPPSNY